MCVARCVTLKQNHCSKNWKVAIPVSLYNLWLTVFPVENPWHVDTSKCKFLTQRKAAEVKVAINALIREGKELSFGTLADIIGDDQLAVLYKLAMSVKQEVLNNTITYFAPKTTLNGNTIMGEGLVFHTVDGSFKVVDRAQFAYANFNQGKFA